MPQDPPRVRPRLRRALGFFLVFLMLLVAGAIFGLPMYVKQQAIESARGYGVSLTIERASVEWKRVHLLKLTARIDAIPGANIVADDVAVDLVGWKPSVVTVESPMVDVTGPIASVSQAAESWEHAVAVPAGGGGGAATLERIDVKHAHVAWKAVLGAGSEVTLEDLTGSAHLDGGRLTTIDFGAPTPARASALTTTGKLVGPFQVGGHAEGGSIDAKLASVPPAAGDPKSPGGATLAVHVNAKDDVHLAFDVARSKPASVGLPLDGPIGTSEVELHGTADALASGGRTGDLHLLLFGVKITDELPPVDAGLDLAWNGDAARPIPIRDGHFRIGPFTGPVSGTIAPRLVDGAVDLAYKSPPLACAKLAGITAGAALGPLGSLLGAVAESSGAVAGDIAISGALSLSAGNLGAAKFSILPTADCGLHFGPKPD